MNQPDTKNRDFPFFNVVFAVCFGITLHVGFQSLLANFGEKKRVEMIEHDTGCKVLIWSPGRYHDCKPFNISHEELNTTAWLCCDTAAVSGKKQ